MAQGKIISCISDIFGLSLIPILKKSLLSFESGLNSTNSALPLRPNLNQNQIQSHGYLSDNHSAFCPAKPPQPAHPAPGTIAPGTIFPDASVSPTSAVATCNMKVWA
jgi:hypothetical protein